VYPSPTASLRLSIESPMLSAGYLVDSVFAGAFLRPAALFESMVVSCKILRKTVFDNTAAGSLRRDDEKNDQS
jgi:hypothetical protein